MNEMFRDELGKGSRGYLFSNFVCLTNYSVARNFQAELFRAMSDLGSPLCQSTSTTLKSLSLGDLAL